MTANRTTRTALRAFATVSTGTLALMLATGEAQAQNVQCRDGANNPVGTIIPASTNNTVCGNATAGGNSNVAIGEEANAQGPSGTPAFGSVAIGYSADAINDTSIAIGAVAIATGSSSMAVGFGANATGPESLALGLVAQSFGNQSIAMGPASVAADSFSVAIGRSADATAEIGRVPRLAGAQSRGFQHIIMQGTQQIGPRDHADDLGPLHHRHEALVPLDHRRFDVMKGRVRSGLVGIGLHDLPYRAPAQPMKQRLLDEFPAHETGIPLLLVQDRKDVQAIVRHPLTGLRNGGLEFDRLHRPGHDILRQQRGPIVGGQ